VFGFLRRRRRSRLLAAPFPDEWRSRLARDWALWNMIPPAARARLEDDLRLFMAEREWEPCGGLLMDDSMRAVIAAQACLLTLGHSVDALDHVRSILVYPDTYHAPDLREDEFGIVTEGVDEREGEAWERGLVVLSWSDLQRDAGRLDGRNLVLHEMAHQVDLADTLSENATGFGAGGDEAARRLDEFLELYERFADEVDAGHPVEGLDTYGAQDEAEFFSVATEAFFECGSDLQAHQPELYEMLVWYYRLDPAAWAASPSSW
jgi:Mlc titration factor MtfA (ptsG expression regulator)